MGDLLPNAPDTYSVKRGDTLWGLAERHLGDGHRYREILDLNLGHPQPDGRALTDAHWLYPGWQLHLPGDATELPAASAVLGAAERASATSHGAIIGRKPEPLSWSATWLA